MARESEIKQMFPSWNTRQPGEWAKEGFILHYGPGDKDYIEISLYREPTPVEDGIDPYTLTVFDGDNVLLTKGVKLAEPEPEHVPAANKAEFAMDDVPEAEIRITEIQAILENDMEMSRREEAELVAEREDLEQKVNHVKTTAMLPEALASVPGLRPCETQGQERCFETELYAAYDDGCSDRQIAGFIDSDDPAMAFEEYMDDVWFESRMHSLDAIEDSVKTYLRHNGVDGDYLDEDPDNEIRQYVMEHVDVKLPFDHYLDQEVCVNIIMDTGDGNYEYTVNAQYPSTAYNAVRPAQPEEDSYVPYDMDTFISDKAGIAWLAKTQGYTRGDLHRALMNDNLIPEDETAQLVSWSSPNPKITFLQSMQYEMANSSSSTPCVCFLVKMTLRQLLILNQLIIEQDRKGRFYDASQNPDCGYITISKETVCGLFDFISGAGSLLELQLEQDVKIPIRFIRSATPNVNGCQGVTYNVKGVYGMCESAWTDTVMEISAPKELANKICLFDGKIKTYGY